MTLKNPFSFFQIPISFNIDEQDLENKFIAMQMEFHPDTSNFDAQKSLNATEYYHILKNDISRGEAIMEIFDINQDTLSMPQSFFPEIMEITEDMMEMTAINAKQIVLDAQNQLLHFKDVSHENVHTFAHQFLKYKYLKKAFVNTHGSW